MAESLAAIQTLCQSLNGKYQAWLEIRSAGMEAMFVRMHLREIRRIVQQIEKVCASETPPVTLDPETARHIELVKLEFVALDRFIAARQQQQSVLECLTGLPEFRLLEIDQALAEPVGPDLLEAFEDEDASEHDSKDDTGEPPGKAE